MHFTVPKVVRFVPRPSQKPRILIPRASSEALGGGQLRAASDWKELTDPIHIYATGNRSVRVENYGEEVSLHNYMTLPVHQYYVLDPSLITSLGNNEFEFSIPKMEFLNEWLQPNVIAEVQVSNEHVHIVTKNCFMNVSELISSLNLDEKWYMFFQAWLTWEDDSSESDKQLRGLDRVSLISSDSRKRYGVMHGKSRVDVWCESAPGMDFIPKEVLQNACNLAMDTLMRSLLPVFMSQLSTDYRKWATNQSYREERATWNLDRFKQKVT